MAILKHYVVSETLKTLFAAIGITLLLLTLGGGIREGIRQGLPLPVVARTLPYMVPEMLIFIIPGTLLYAVCSVFGRMTATNELTALKSLGVNPLCLVWPVLAVAFLLSVVTFGMYDVCAAWSRPGLRQLVIDSVDRIVLGFLRTNGSYTGQGVSIVVKGVQGDRLLQPVITVEPRGDTPRVTLTAREARLSTAPLTGSLLLECWDGAVDVGDRPSFRFAGRFVHEIALYAPDPHAEDNVSPVQLPSRRIDHQVRRERERIADLETQLAAVEREDQEERDSLLRQLRDRRLRLNRLRAEVPRRLSNGLGCFCFALIGIPVAMRWRSADTMSVFILCFLPILLLYYPLLVVGENLARKGTMPQLSVWLADAVLLLAGAWLLKRRLRW
jgi:lipopolysaccharide export system permease protein